MQQPKTKKDKVTENHFEIEISDNYRWLEKKDTETNNWISEQNKYTKSNLINNTQQKINQELVKSYETTDYANPVLANGRYFFREIKQGENQMVLYYKNKIDGEPIELINPNKMSKEGMISLDFWENSRSGKYLVYGLSEDGTEMAKLNIIEVETGKKIDETINNCRYSTICWLSDDSGFYYTKNPEPRSVPDDELVMHTKVYFHKIGDNIRNDKLIFGKDRPKDDMLGIDLSPDDKFLSIQVSQNWSSNDLYIYDAKKDELNFLMGNSKNKFDAYFLENKIIVKTNYKTDNYKIISSDYNSMYKDVNDWDSFIEPKKDFIFKTITITKSKILVRCMYNACSEVIIYNHDAKKLDKLPIPKYSTVYGISGDIFEEDFFYSYASFVEPRIIYMFDSKTETFSIYKKTENHINANDYNIKQEWFNSSDGESIPMFIIHKKDIEYNKENPTIVYGYGGFGISQTPAYLKNFIPWLERGGVIAIINIRGGGEFGEKWHENGVKENKQKSYDDFIFGCEKLIDLKITKKEKIGIIGGSNGGLLTAAASVQRPDLFNSVVSMVPLIDMVRFYKFGMAYRWTNEYGNPENKKELKDILKWSPYHNVDKDVEYPNYLFTTADKDSRVEPFHARKMTALLQNVNKKNKVYLYTEFKAGHGPGAPVSKRVFKQSIVLTFFAENLGLIV